MKDLDIVNLKTGFCAKFHHAHTFSHPFILWSYLRKRRELKLLEKMDVLRDARRRAAHRPS